MTGMLNDSEASSLRDFLRRTGYAADTLSARYGSAVPPTARNVDRLLQVSQRPEPLNALVRLFLAGSELSREAFESLVPQDIRLLLETAGLVESSGEAIRAGVVVVPVGDLLFASHAFHRLAGGDAGNFVMPASTHSARFLEKLTLREPVSAMLDLGCGCGLHALAAAGHADRVVATDVNPAALGFTRFNAKLNGIDNVDCREGDRFAPVAGERFGLIVSNPPFVIAPDERFRYRDNPEPLDTFCASLVEQAPGFLDDNGVFQMLGEWAEIEGEHWQARIAAEVRSSGCDTWVLHGQAMAPADYVATRRADVSGPAAAPSVAYGEWLAHLESRQVRAVHPAMVLLRRRNGKNWFYLRSLTGEPGQGAAASVQRALAACDDLAGLEADSALRDAVLEFVPELELEQRFARQEGSWFPTRSRLVHDEGLPAAADVDLPVMAFLNQLDGQRPVSEVLAAFATAVRSDPAKLEGDLLPVLRLLLGRGFLRRAETTPSGR